MPDPSKTLDLGTRIPAPVIRRIAEAADGVRGRENWIAFSTQEEEPERPEEKGKHFVSKAITRAEAEVEADQKPNRFAIGPFETPKKSTNRNREVTGVKVESKAENNETVMTRHIGPQDADALFWTESAIDKFLIPYYVQIHGWEYGREIAAAFDSPNVDALTHLPGSEYAAKLTTNPIKGMESIIVPILPGDAKRALAAADTAAPESATPEGEDDAS